MSLPKTRLDLPRLTMHFVALLPLILLLLAALTGGLSVNPIQDATQRMGQAAILLWIASLACTPVFIITGWRKANAFRRPLGLYAAFYAAVHFILFAGVDYGFSLSLIAREVAEKRYIIVGLVALLILLALAVTSFRWWKARLGKRWKWRHRLAYLAAVLAVFHYGWVAKGDFLALSGSVLQPWIYGGIVLLLLFVRIPPIRRALQRRRDSNNRDSNA